MFFVSSDKLAMERIRLELEHTQTIIKLLESQRIFFRQAFAACQCLNTNESLKVSLDRLDDEIVQAYAKYGKAPSLRELSKRLLTADDSGGSGGGRPSSATISTLENDESVVVGVNLKALVPKCARAPNKKPHRLKKTKLFCIFDDSCHFTCFTQRSLLHHQLGHRRTELIKLVTAHGYLLEEKGGARIVDNFFENTCERVEKLPSRCFFASCGTGFKDATAYKIRQHLNLHLEDILFYPCYRCTKIFSRRTDLFEHFLVSPVCREANDAELQESFKFDLTDLIEGTVGATDVLAGSSSAAKLSASTEKLCCGHCDEIYDRLDLFELHQKFLHSGAPAYGGDGPSPEGNGTSTNRLSHLQAEHQYHQIKATEEGVEVAEEIIETEQDTLNNYVPVSNSDGDVMLMPWELYREMDENDYFRLNDQLIQGDDLFLEAASSTDFNDEAHEVAVAMAMDIETQAKPVVVETSSGGHQGERLGQVVEEAKPVEDSKETSLSSESEKNPKRPLPMSLEEIRADQQLTKLFTSYIYECSLCDYSFRHESELALHLHSVHKATSYCCDECPFVTQDVDLFGKHEATHQGQASQLPQSQPAANVCSICGLVLSKPKWLKLHMEKLHTSRQCPNCPVVCEDSKQLHCHLSSFHKDCKFSCTQCTYTTLDDEKFEAHCSVHRASRRCPFDGCGDEFRSAERLDTHINRFHRKEKPFKCDLCDQAFYGSNYLTVHQKNDHKQLVHKCDQCGYKTNNSPNLRNHLLSHSQERNFACEALGCGSRFKTSRLLASHRMYKHEVKKFRCTRCGKGYPTGKLLKGHEQKCSIGIEMVENNVAGETSCAEVTLHMSTESELSNQASRVIVRSEQGNSPLDKSTAIVTRRRSERHRLAAGGDQPDHHRPSRSGETLKTNEINTNVTSSQTKRFIPLT